MAGLAVHTLFYLALTLMMGVLTSNRNTVLGVSLGALLGGLLIVQTVGGYLGTAAMLTPWRWPWFCLPPFWGCPCRYRSGCLSASQPPYRSSLWLWPSPGSSDWSSNGRALVPERPVALRHK